MPSPYPNKIGKTYLLLQQAIKESCRHDPADVELVFVSADDSRQANVIREFGKFAAPNGIEFDPHGTTTRYRIAGVSQWNPCWIRFEHDIENPTKSLGVKSKSLVYFDDFWEYPLMNANIRAYAGLGGYTVFDFTDVIAGYKAQVPTFYSHVRRVTVVADRPQAATCECGSSKLKLPRHSSWCPVAGGQ